MALPIPPVDVGVAVVDISGDHEVDDMAALAKVYAANLVTASFALLASIPVPAARPITAADNSAMIHDRTKVNRLQPHIILPFPPLFGVV